MGAPSSRGLAAAAAEVTWCSPSGSSASGCDSGYGRGAAPAAEGVETIRAFPYSLPGPVRPSHSLQLVQALPMTPTSCATYMAAVPLTPTARHEQQRPAEAQGQPSALHLAATESFVPPEPIAMPAAAVPAADAAVAPDRKKAPPGKDTILRFFKALR